MTKKPEKKSNKKELNLSFSMPQALKKLCSIIILLTISVIAKSQDPKYPSSITVAQDGTGNYKTVQEAVNSVRDLGVKRVNINIKAGVYREKLVIPTWKTSISLIGENNATTIITNDDYS